jgi:Sap-like sulfolipid-1-addressing protein
VGQAISDILPYAIGVAISPVPIIAVILMLFSARAKVNGPLFMTGWAAALAVVAGAAYLLSTAGDAGTDSGASDGVSWSQVVFGVLFLLLAGRSWRNQPEPGAEPAMPKWMAGIDSFTPGKALGLGALLGGVNPKNLLLSLGAGSSLAQLDAGTTDTVVALIVFVLLGSITVAGPVVYYLVGGDRAKAELDTMKTWLGAHNAAVMTVLFLVFGVVLIAKGIPPLT